MDWSVSEVLLGNSTCALGIPEVCQSTQETLFFQIRAIWVMSVLVVLLGLLAGHFVHTLNVDFLPESLVTVILGGLLGLMLWCSPWMGRKFYLDAQFIRLGFAWMLNLVCLPIIIFESGWSLRLRDFVSQFGYIMMFAIVGTVVSVLVVASLIHATRQWHGVHCWRTIYAFASLISSVDPVSTLSTFGSLNVDPLLFILVFGESQINDAVAITLFRALNDEGVEGAGVLAVKMATVLFGSIFIGGALGMVYILILRFARMGKSSAQAILLIFVSCFFTFSVGEWLGFSGIIAVLFNSILMGAFSGAHLTNECMALASYLLKQMSVLAETLIFLYCGVLAVFVATTAGQGLRFGFMIAVICLVGRFAAIIPLGLLANAIKYVVGKRLPKERQHMISWRHLFMMWHSGLRGGVSLVLVMELGDWVDEEHGEETRTLLTNGTFIMVVLYLVLFGSTTGFFLRLLGIPLGDEVPEGQTLYDSSDKSGYGWKMLKYLRRVVMPILVGNATGHKRARSATSGGNVLAEVIRGAEEAENRADFGQPERRPNQDLQRRSSAKNSALVQLFGSDDPAHTDAFEDIVSHMLTMQTSQALESMSETSPVSDSDVSDSSGTIGGDLEHLGDPKRRL